MSEKAEKTSTNFQNEMKLLNQLPYAISVHDSNDTIVYENEKATELFGIRIDDSCQSRWCHHTDNVSNTCPLCPGKFTKRDITNHKVFRKLIDPDLHIRYLEFETVPVFNANKESDGFIEIIRDVTEGEKIKIKNLEANLGEKKFDRIFTLIKHGLTGSEVIFSDKIFFVDDIKSFLMKLAGFAFIGVVQNDAERQGLFGPLPVLDQKTYEMYAYTFGVNDFSIVDPRKNHHELILLLIIFERNDKITTVNRALINDLIGSYIFNLQSIEDLTNDWYELLKTEINKLIDS